MLRHRPIERTDDAIWRSAIRFGLVKASIANETMLAGGEATAWCDGAHVAAFGCPPNGGVGTQMPYGGSIPSPNIFLDA